MTTSKKAVATRRKAPAPVVQPISQYDKMLELAITGNADLDSLKELIALKNADEDRQAEKAMTVALGAFQADQQVIAKDKASHNAKYASLAGTISQLQENMSKHGLSRSWEPLQDKERGIGITCTISHDGGGRRHATLWAEADTSGNKNDIQAMGSTVSYLERYTLYAALGITSAEMIDDDGRMAGKTEALVTTADIKKLTTLLAEAKADVPKFLEAFFIETLEQLPKLKVAQATAVLNRKIKETKNVQAAK